ncbi:MAG: hydroxymethylbilane synthase [Crocinitomicaceae bacterium]|nr:hydroxymethylbilane synthase [Crocinitomicaceae bacterium]MBK8927616.1 hydroxymethylbilane synthase [Crocinitomicaceae bacterium]
MKIRIGSRGSDLALWQANFVKAQLENLGHQVEIKIIVTRGDRIQDLSFDKIEGKGFFTKEIEEALLNNEVDLAVHSHKDLETTNPEGLIIGAVSYREEPNDILLIHPSASDKSQPFSLAVNAVVGTSAARRKSQLKRLRPDCLIEDLRGNVPTRVQKLRDGKYGAIVLACAGVERLRLNLEGLHVMKLAPEDFVPAPAQGVLGLQIRQQDIELAQALKKIHHEDVAESIQVERDVLRLMEGGCQLPLGIYCQKLNTEFHVLVSYSKSSAEAGKLYQFNQSSSAGLAEKIVQELKRG